MPAPRRRRARGSTIRARRPRPRSPRSRIERAYRLLAAGRGILRFPSAVLLFTKPVRPSIPMRPHRPQDRHGGDTTNLMLRSAAGLSKPSQHVIARIWPPRPLFRALFRLLRAASHLSRLTIHCSRPPITAHRPRPRHMRGSRRPAGATPADFSCCPPVQAGRRCLLPIMMVQDVVSSGLPSAMERLELKWCCRARSRHLPRCARSHVSARL